MVLAFLHHRHLYGHFLDQPFVKVHLSAIWRWMLVSLLRSSWLRVHKDSWAAKMKRADSLLAFNRMTERLQEGVSIKENSWLGSQQNMKKNMSMWFMALTLNPKHLLLSQNFRKSGRPTVAFSTETLLVISRPVHCFTLGRGRRAESYLGQQWLNKPNFIHELVQEVAQM